MPFSSLVPMIVLACRTSAGSLLRSEKSTMSLSYVIEAIADDALGNIRYALASELDESLIPSQHAGIEGRPG
jgi:hypothetical protein